MNRKILLITERPPMVAGFLQLLDLAGLGNEFAIINPGDLSAAVTNDCLLVIDVEPGLDWDELAGARRNHPGAIFVLWCSRVTPHLAMAAIDAGVHGLLSTRLPVPEAAQALMQICGGDRYFRFEPDLDRRPAASRSYETRPFDASWMFPSATSQP